MLTLKTVKLISRAVDNDGEILVVRDRCGLKVLTDPLYKNVAVVVPVGRHAELVDFAFPGVLLSSGRDALVVAICSDAAGLGFASVQRPAVKVNLQDLAEGQLVDVLPLVEPAAAFQALPRPMPVFNGAVALPVYACAAA